MTAPAPTSASGTDAPGPAAAWLVVLAALASLGGALAASPLLTVGPWLAAAAVGHWRRSANRLRARRRLAADLPTFVDTVIQQLQGGGSLSRAVRTTLAPASVEERLLTLRSSLDAGLGLGAALERQQRRATESGTAPAEVSIWLLVNTLVVLVERGGPALPSLERLNDTLRSATAIEAEVQVQAGQATASALVLAGLPVLFMTGLVLVEERLRHFYLFDSAGAVCVLLAVALSYGGWAWMQRIIGPHP